MTERDPEKDLSLLEPLNYVADTRLLCEGMPFVLTDVAHPRLVLKHGGHFLVLDQSASMPTCNTLGYGYYRNDTRHLSQWEMYLNDAPLSLLSSDVERGFAGRFLYTNPQFGAVHQQKVTIHRTLVLDEMLWEELIIENYHHDALDVELQIRFQSDFADMFEVRGLNREQRGQRMLPVSSPDGRRLFLAYRGLDKVLSETIVEFFDLLPQQINDGTAHFRLHLPTRSPIKIKMCLWTRLDGQEMSPAESKIGLAAAHKTAVDKYQVWRASGARMSTEHELVNIALDRGFRDIYILRQPTPKGYGLAAGIPWYGAVFGRDSAITAWQILPFHQDTAQECLNVLAAYQGQQKDSYREERPGKIMHELRLGELARTKLIPHSPYYGTVDATALWLLLLCEYAKWTGNLDLVMQLWPAVKLALKYLDKAVDEGNGYLTYCREGPHGLENQGWKDSGDAIMHADGVLAEAPIAVCEAQAYLYAAYVRLADLADRLEQKQLAKKMRIDARELKARFQRDFWMEDLQYLAMALDGHGKQVKSVASNPGHCLFTGILDDIYAHKIADRLMSAEMHTGWGIRTLSSTVQSFNPISYHNGTVWPHDNSIIGEGMRVIGRLDDMQKILQGLVEVAAQYPQYRLPELFGGFDRGESDNPIEYPVSCSPQSWAAGSIFQMIKTCLNFVPDAVNRQLRIVEPALPDWLGQVTIRNLHVGQASVDLAFHSQDGLTYCQILKKDGPLKILIEN